MIKETYFDNFDEVGWPNPSQLAPYFLGPKGKEWSYLGGNDTWSLSVEGLFETEHLTPKTGRVDVRLFMCGHPDHGVHLSYHRWDGRTMDKVEYLSKGDLDHLREWVRSRHGTALPIGLFVPFRAAYLAVKEFIETDGKLPTSIEWIDGRDIPDDVFPR